MEEMNIKTAAQAGKEMMTFAEAAAYMGVSKSYLYKLTHLRKIPHYKPTGKLVYFKRAEVNEWLQGVRVATEGELNEKAAAYCMKGGAL